MAITAAITLTPSSVTYPASFEAKCTITNTGSSDVTVTGCHPSVTANGLGSAAMNLGKPAIMPGQNVTVPGSSGTLDLFWFCRALSPGGPSDGFPATPASQAYVLGAVVYTSDGSVTNASTASITVTAPTAT